MLFVEQAEHEKGFAAHFEQHVAPKLKALEKRRCVLLRWFYIACLISFPTAALIGSLIDAYYGTLDLKGVLMLLAAAMAWPVLVYRRYGAQFKKEILPEILSFFGNTLSWAEGGISLSEFVLPESFLPPHDDATCSDGFIGSYKEVRIQMTELTLKERKEKNRTSVSFRGLLLELTFNKPFLGQTLVVPDRGVFSFMFQRCPSSMQRIELEDPEFEKCFEAYSTDPVEARYLLTTSFMERLLQLNQTLQYWGNVGAVGLLPRRNAHTLRCSFLRGNVVLLVPCSANLFEAGGLFVAANHLEEIRSLLLQIHLVYRIIEDLKLAQRIGL